MSTLLTLILSVGLLGQVMPSARRIASPTPAAAGGGGGTVTLDTSAKGADNAATCAITVANNANRVLYAFAGSGIAAGADQVESISSSLDGAFTEVVQQSDSSWCNVQIWRLVNPTAGSHTITVTFEGSEVQRFVQAASVYDVNTSDPDDTHDSGSGTGTQVTGTVTLTAGQMALGAIASDDDDGFTVSIGTELQQNAGVAGDTTYGSAYNTGTGSVQVRWTQDNQLYAYILLPINPTP